jgi:hypothetical protein
LTETKPFLLATTAPRKPMIRFTKVPRLPQAETAADRASNTDDLTAAWIAQPVRETVREHVIGNEARHPSTGARALQRRLHRRARDAVRLRDLRLEREHDHRRDSERYAQSIAVRSGRGRRD